MGVVVELQNTGASQNCREITAVIEHTLSEKPGEWNVSIIGSHANDNWELRIQGPNGFERSYILSGTAGEHTLGGIRNVLAKLVSANV